MIGMGVRYADAFDVRGFDADLLELADKRLAALPTRPAVFALKPVGHCRHRIGDAGIPEEPALRVMDQIAIIGEIDRHADIDARRPARLIGTKPLTAIEHVELVDTRGLRGCRWQGDCAKHRNKRSDSDGYPLHDFLPFYCRGL